MKYTLFYILLSVGLFSCKYFSDEKEPAVNPNKCTQYACPVHPDITSTTLEKCPSCNAVMIPVNDSLKLKRDSLKHSGKQIPENYVK